MIKIPELSSTIEGGVKSVFLFNRKDLIIEDGVPRIKRKYGKIKRYIVELTIYADSNNIKLDDK